MTDLPLSLGAQQAVVDTLGGRIRSYHVAGHAVLVGDEPTPQHVYRGSLLAPWPNRVADGSWSWQGRLLQLEINEPSLNTALHGLVAYEEFSVVTRTSHSAKLAYDLRPSAGYPFALRIEADYALGDDGLTCSLRARNTGAESAPVALGVHPYIDTHGLVDDVTLQLPARRLVVGDAAWQETGRLPVQQTDLDFLEPRRIGSAAIDACWTDVQPDPDGRVRCRVGLPDQREVVLWGGPTTRCLVVYNGDTLAGEAHRRSIAVEPCTAPANAFRSGTDLDVLAPGETLDLAWGAGASWLT